MLMMIRDLVTTVMRNIGYEAYEAVDGVDALGKLNYEEFDVIVTDLSMPRMGGIELIKRAKALCPGVQILAITAYPSLDAGIQAMKEGASDFISKPFKLEQITLCVDKILNEGRLLRQKADLSDTLQRQYQIRKVNEALYEQIRENTLLRTISEDINKADKNTSLLSMIVNMISDIVKAEVIVVGVVNDGCFFIKEARGYQANHPILMEGTILEKATLTELFTSNRLAGPVLFLVSLLNHLFWLCL